MEINAGLIYLISVLGTLDCTLRFIINISITMTPIITVMLAIKGGYSFNDFYNSKLFKIAKQIFITVLILLVISIFIPNKKTMIAMVVTPIITNNESIQNISDKSLKAIEKLLDEYIKEDTSENKE